MEFKPVSFGLLTQAVFLERPNRFVAVVEHAGKRRKVHVPDPGRLQELLIPGCSVYVRLAEPPRPERKTEGELILVRAEKSLVCVDTRIPNQLVTEALRHHVLPGFSDYDTVKPEFTHGKSRFDAALLNNDDNDPVCMIEVKAVSWVTDGIGLFPDAPTTRGQRHVRELTELHSTGTRTAVVFVSQREDTKEIQPAAERDPGFTEALRAAGRAGVELFGWRCDVSTSGIRLSEPVPVVLE